MSLKSTPENSKKKNYSEVPGAAVKENVDVTAMFQKMGSKLGWFQYKNLDSAAHTLSSSAKKKSSKPRRKVENVLVESERHQTKINVSEIKKTKQKFSFDDTSSENDEKSDSIYSTPAVDLTRKGRTNKLSLRKQRGKENTNPNHGSDNSKSSSELTKLKSQSMQDSKSYRKLRIISSSSDSDSDDFGIPIQESTRIFSRASIDTILDDPPDDLKQSFEFDLKRKTPLYVSTKQCVVNTKKSEKKRVSIGHFQKFSFHEHDMSDESLYQKMNKLELSIYEDAKDTKELYTTAVNSNSNEIKTDTRLNSITKSRASVYFDARSEFSLSSDSNGDDSIFTEIKPKNVLKSATEILASGDDSILTEIKPKNVLKSATEISASSEKISNQPSEGSEEDISYEVVDISVQTDGHEISKNEEKYSKDYKRHTDTSESSVGEDDLLTNKKDTNKQKLDTSSESHEDCQNMQEIISNKDNSLTSSNEDNSLTSSGSYVEVQDVSSQAFPVEVDKPSSHTSLRLCNEVQDQAVNESGISSGNISITDTNKCELIKTDAEELSGLNPFNSTERNPTSLESINSKSRQQNLDLVNLISSDEEEMDNVVCDYVSSDDSDILPIRTQDTSGANQWNGEEVNVMLDILSDSDTESYTSSKSNRSIKNFIVDDWEDSTDNDDFYTRKTTDLKEKKKFIRIKKTVEILSSDSSSDELPDIPKTEPKKVQSKTPVVQDSKPKTSMTKLGQTSAERIQTYSFLKSLSQNLPPQKCDFNAVRYLKNFARTKDELISNLFKMYNETVFENKLPVDLPIIWNKRMLKTAGYCVYKREVKGDNRSVRIELSTKVCDCAERVRDTLLHELCHAAVWLINGIKEGHGPYWKYWARKTNVTHPEIPVVTRCHSYSIQTKYIYQCSQCKYQIGRHSKSLDTEKKVCGHCRGKFILLDKSGGSRTSNQTPKTPNKFAMFVKEHYKDVRKGDKSMKHADVMNILSKEFSKQKIS